MIHSQQEILETVQITAEHVFADRNLLSCLVYNCALASDFTDNAIQWVTCDKANVTETFVLHEKYSNTMSEYNDSYLRFCKQELGKEIKICDLAFDWFIKQSIRVD